MEKELVEGVIALAKMYEISTKAIGFIRIFIQPIECLQSC